MSADTRVLVVDDHADLAESVAQLLRLRGYDARTAGDGAQALAACEQFVPDCVVLDLAMPRMDGPTLARALRERRGSEIVLVALTGRRDVNVGSDELEAVDHWLTKPLDMDRFYTIFPDIRGG